jgi:hypothetical protein
MSQSKFTISITQNIISENIDNIKVSKDKIYIKNFTSNTSDIIEKYYIYTPKVYKHINQ